jgi:hypothetical protein
MIENDTERALRESLLPEKPNLDYKNASYFYIAGNEYDNNYVLLFINRPEWIVSDGGKTFWVVYLKHKKYYYGLKIPRFLADKFNLPDFDHSRSLVKIHENPKKYFEDRGFTFVDGKLTLL